MYVIKDGVVSKPSKGCITTKPVSNGVQARTDVIGPYWADQSAQNHVDNHQGTKGSVSDADFGTSANVSEVSAVFGILEPDIDLKYAMINGVDSSGDGWAGYVEKAVEVERGGDYELYILCFGGANRKYNVYVDGELAAVTDGIIGQNDSTNERAYSTSNCLNILKVDVLLNAGENTIKLQGAGGGPNFVAFALVKTELEIPADGMQLWLRADRGVTADESGYVTKWADLSGYGHNAVPDSTDTAPTLKENAKYEEPAVVFDGQDDYLKFPFEEVIAGKSDVTVVIVSSTEKDNPSNNTNGDQDPLLYFDETSDGWGKFAVTPFRDKISIRLHGQGSHYIVDKTVSDVNNDFSTTTIVKSGTTINVYDKDAEIATLNNVPLNIERVVDEYGYIGTNKTNYFAGSIAEIIIYDKAVDVGVVQSINEYLRPKYYRQEIELTGGLDIFNGTQTDGTTTPGAAATNTYIKNVFGQGGWQSGSTYPYGVSDDYRAAFDGDITTYYDGPKSGYCGVEFNEPQVVKRIAYQARNLDSRLNGAVLQGSNDGTNYTDIMTIENASVTELNYAYTGCTTAYKYIRLKRNDTTVLNLFELKMYTFE